MWRFSPVPKDTHAHSSIQLTSTGLDFLSAETLGPVISPAAVSPRLVVQPASAASFNTSICHLQHIMRMHTHSVALFHLGNRGNFKPTCQSHTARCQTQADLIKETLELASTERSVVTVGARKEQGGMLFYYGYCRVVYAGYNFSMYEQCAWHITIIVGSRFESGLQYTRCIPSLSHFSAVNSVCIEEESANHLGWNDHSC